MMRNKYLILSVLCLLFFFANAQSHNEQVTVEGKYRPQIKRSERIVKNPAEPSNDFFLPNYSVEDRDFDFDYDLEVETLSAMQYKGQYGVEEKENFLKAGIGSRLSPVFLFRHYSDLSRKMSIGVGVNHYSSWLNMKDYKKSSFMNNAFDLVSNVKFKSGQLRVSGNYKYDMYYLRPISASEENDVARDIHSFNAGLQWTANGTSYRDFYNVLGFDYKRTWIAGGISEDMLNAKAHVSYSDNWIGKRDKGNLQTVAVDFLMTYNNVNQGLIILSANPYFNIDGEFFRVRLGAMVDMKTYDKVGFYPDLSGSVFVLEDKLEFFASLGGKSKINTLSQMVSENPFVNSNFLDLSEFGYEKTPIDFQGGVRVRVANNLDASARVGYSIRKNGVFYLPESVKFLNDSVSEKPLLQTFDIIFLDYDMLRLVFDLRWRVNEQINVSAELCYNKYDVRTEDVYGKAWYKPSLEVDVRGCYVLDEEWSFNAHIKALGSRPAIGLDGNEVSLKPAIDLGLGSDYQLAQNLTAFAEIHNMVHNKYQLYYNYPSVGFELFLGMKYRF